jgi:hypothetical protein
LNWTGIYTFSLVVNLKLLKNSIKISATIKTRLKVLWLYGILPVPLFSLLY